MSNIPVIPQLTLDWKNFEWKYFQVLGISIAKEFYPDCNFDEYLTQGQKQDGIDLLSFHKTDGKFICIQCKSVKKITVNQLEGIISEFVEGNFLDKASCFVIMTTATMQSSDLQLAINNHKIKFNSDYNIDFECWDKQSIENKLRYRPDLVAKFFGEYQALAFSYPQARIASINKIELPKDYISRKIIPFVKPTTNSTFNWTYTTQKNFDIKEILLADNLVAKRICLIADAYFGKSSYLKNLTSELSKNNSIIQPVFIELKNQNIETIDKLLDEIIPHWQYMPSKNLVLIIDGVDEVLTDKFNTTITSIKNFCNSYQPISVILSCRKFFYNKYDVAFSLPDDFQTYELANIEYAEQDLFLKTKLGSLYSTFREEIFRSGFEAFLYNPFYLVNITDQYLQPPHRLPQSKIQVITNLIASSNKVSEKRSLRGSDSIKDETILFNRAIERFAFALQLAGANSFNNEEMQELFTAEQKLLLQHNSLVHHSGENWSFVNALFQEHIAAKLLSKMDFDDIVFHCTIGDKIKKIKTKWIQTISSLLSILESDNPLFTKVIELIENDNIELIFQTDGSKYDSKTKVTFLEKLITRCIKQDLRPMVVYEDTIGQFIYSSPECADFILNTISKEDSTITVKLVCCKILKDGNLNDLQKSTFLDFANKELRIIVDNYYAKQLVKVISRHKIGDEKLIIQLISIAPLIQNHEYRDGLYELITNFSLTEKFYDFGLSGLEFLLAHNKDVLHGGSERNWENFLLAPNSYNCINQLLLKFEETEWLQYFARDRGYRNFVDQLFDKLSSLFKEHKVVIVPVSRLIKELSKKYLGRELPQIDSFLNTTNSHSLVLRLLIRDIFEGNLWQLGSLVTQESYDYILFEFEEGNYEPKKLQNFVSGLRYGQRGEIADKLFDLCIEATEGKIVNVEENAKMKLYYEVEETKVVNDLKYIKSLKEFRKGVIKFFKAYGSKTILANDLYFEIGSYRSQLRQKVDSNFIYKYLSRHANQTEIQLSDCIDELQDLTNFSNFRAEEILDYSHTGEYIDKVLTPIIKQYYFDNLPNSNFENCLWQDENMFHWRKKEVRLGDIFKKYKFDTPLEQLVEFIWLDQSGIRIFQDKNISIVKIILDILDDEGKKKLRKKVIENMLKGIKLELVLGTHIAMCKELKIYGALGLILTSIHTISDNYTTRTEAVNIYLALGGDINNILALYKSLTEYNQYFFYFLTSKLYKVFPKEVSEIGSKALNSSEVELEMKTRIAQILAEIGEFSSFSFLVKELRDKKTAPHYIQQGHRITNMDTKEVINELDDIMYLMLDKNYDNAKSFHDSPKNLILEWLYTLAAKSQQDLILVVQFLESSMNKLSAEYQNATDFNWYINRALEDFRNSDKSILSIVETKAILSSLTI